MDRRERFDDPVEAQRAALDGRQAELWTALPGVVQSFDPVAMTVSVQPAIKGRVSLPDGSAVSVSLPLLVDVPVVFPCGGGYTLTFPVAPGDDCLVVFASRCIDGWWQVGGVQEPLETRMHDLSDAFCLVGPRSQPAVIPDVSTTTTQLRTDDGQVYVELAQDGQVVTINTPGRVVINAAQVEINASESFQVNTAEAEIAAGSSLTMDTPQTDVTGAVAIANAGGAAQACTFQGTIKTTGGDVQADGVSLKGHVHTGVTTGSDLTGTPQQ